MRKNALKNAQKMRKLAKKMRKISSDVCEQKTFVWEANVHQHKYIKAYKLSMLFEEHVQYG